MIVPLQYSVLVGVGISVSAVGSKLVIVSNNDRVHHQLSASSLVEELGEENIYEGTEWLGEATARAHSDAEAWIRSRS